jgi:3-deoxy-D-manno-octulosonic-acid transferase
MAFFSVASLFLIALYAGAMLLATGLLHFVMKRRLDQGKETPERIQQRKGKGPAPYLHPDQKIIWIHGASVGEMKSALPLVQEVLDAHPNHCILLTSQTLSSEEVLKPYLSNRVFYQAAPLDHPLYWRRFFNTWNPQALCVFEAECWPFLFFYAGYIRKIALLSINFHISRKSAKKWLKIPWFFRFLYSPFQWVSSSCPFSLQAYNHLMGNSPVHTVSLKYATFKESGTPLKKTEINLPKNRAVWMASCFHDNEREELSHLILRMHRILPGLLTVLAPRHLDQLEQWELKIKPLNIKRDDFSGDVCLISQFGVLTPYYQKIPVVLLGGSFVQIGGHNLIEPAQFGCSIICGPNMNSCLDILEDFKKRHAVYQVQNFSAAYDQVISCMAQPCAAGLRAKEVVEHQRQKASDTLKQIVKVLSERTSSFQPPLSMG